MNYIIDNLQQILGTNNLNLPPKIVFFYILLQLCIFYIKKLGKPSFFLKNDKLEQIATMTSSDHA